MIKLPENLQWLYGKDTNWVQTICRTLRNKKLNPNYKMELIK
ncbi:hypothetical protein SAMN05444483_101151 [Salegentibacter echinorum]|uniref:Uncharacterized protein n=1 Tax=Salegentibacter echinorum TaxID=1073325 RepID=A0A1M5BQV2_SALEC|nr:hypothetical protein SAMN05444483_101151 [Salegentibacter echinorum]